MKHLKTPVLAGGLLAVLVTALLLAAAAIYPSIAYSVEADFASLPADDATLVVWLKTQPGVVPNTVHVNRLGPQQQRVQIIFIQSRNLFGLPHFPALERGCRELGYDGRVAPFRDSPRQ